MHFHRISVS